MTEFDPLQFFARFHPVIVHLPIGFILLLAALEILSRFARWKDAKASAGFILAMTVPVAGLAAASGWLLSRGGSYEATLVRQHFWTGLATLAGCLIAAMLYWRGRLAAYRTALFLTVPVLVIASHFGGSLTHGRGHLTRYAPSWLRGGAAVALPARAGDSEAEFDTVAKPILDQYCAGCHGPEKAKGGLRVDTLAALRAGGDSGPALVPGNPQQSELLRRMRLPLADEDHMPPEGKPQPGEGERAVLERWVAGLSASASTRLNGP